MLDAEHRKTLTPREHEILALTAKGKRNVQIGEELCIAVSTVENHLHNIYGKLSVPNRTAAAIYAMQAGLVQLLPQQAEAH